MNKRLFGIVCSMLLLTSTLMAQQKKSFTLNDLLPGGSTFWNLQPEHLFTTWWGDVLVKTEVDKCSSIEAQKKQKTLFTLDLINRIMGATDKNKVRSLHNVRFPYLGKTQVLVTSDRQLLLVDWKAKSVVWSKNKVPGAIANDMTYATRNEAYVKEHNLYVMTADGKEHQVSTDGSPSFVYGQSVHRDEFGINKGTYWSPKGHLLAFYRMDQSMVTDYPLVDISKRIASYEPEKYPMAGTTSHKVTVGVFNPQTDQTIWLQAGDPTNRYFTNISWSPDEKTIYLIELNRDQNHAELIAYDATTGERKAKLYEERHNKYVHPTHGLTFLPWDDHLFLYQSERDGYNHLYLFDTTGKEIKQLTKGKFIVNELLGFNSKTKSVILKSTEASPIQKNLYSVNVATSKRTLLDAGTGVHNGVLSANGTFLCDRYSAPGIAVSYDLVNTQTAKQTKLLTPADPWEHYNLPEVTCSTLKAADGKTDLYYRLVKPIGFDPTQKYPTIVYTYGGPGLRLVEATNLYQCRGWELYMAQKGYVIFVLDNRGSCERGLDFENATFHQLGNEEMKDQLKGVEYLKSLPYVDAHRLGVHGWSFGGFMTTNLMLSYPDVFKVGVAGGPVIDWQYYEVMYGERYMGTPQTNPEGYKNSNLRLKAGNLKGRLQIIFGYNDPVCVPQHTLSFLRSCIDAGTQPDLFTYPGQEHNMAGQDRVHLHERITRYFEDYLK